MLLDNVASDPPGVGTNVGSNLDVITPDFGLVFTLGNFLELPSCIEISLQNQAKLLVLSQNALRKVINHHDWSEIAKNDSGNNQLAYKIYYVNLHKNLFQ